MTFPVLLVAPMPKISSSCFPHTCGPGQFQATVLRGSDEWVPFLWGVGVRPEGSTPAQSKTVCSRSAKVFPHVSLVSCTTAKPMAESVPRRGHSVYHDRPRFCNTTSWARRRLSPILPNGTHEVAPNSHAPAKVSGADITTEVPSTTCRQCPRTACTCSGHCPQTSDWRLQEHGQTLLDSAFS